MNRKFSESVIIIFSKSKFLLKLYYAEIFLVLILIVTLPMVRYYGLAWDEPAQREIGQVNFEYVFGISESLIYHHNKYYGPLFEFILISLEKITSLKSTESIYLFRHYVSFLFFYLTCIVFYRFNYNLFKSKMIAMSSFIFLFISPRVFADSIYNTKDIPFLAFYFFSTYTYLLFFTKKSVKNSILHGIICGLSTSIRIGSLYIFIATLFIQSIIFVKCLLKRQIKLAIATLSNTLAFIIAFFLTTYISWPILWRDTTQFFSAIQVFEKYRWNGEVLFKGEFISATHLPWDYLPTWIAITTPIVVLFLFCFSIICLLFQVELDRKYSQKISSHNRMAMLLMPILAFPLLSVLIFKPVLYDGWRHFFFIYPPIIIFSIFGFRLLSRNLRIVVVCLYLIEILMFNVKSFSKQFVYFNLFAGSSYSSIKQRYEMDYWGVSSIEVLRELVAKNPGKITVVTDSPAVKINRDMLNASDQKRISFVENSSTVKADYFIGAYRSHPYPYNCKQEIYSTIIQDAALISAFDFNTCDKNP